MREAPVPNYTAVPCPRCMSRPSQTCTINGSCRQRRQLWAALLDAQSKGRNQVWWYGRSIQIETRLGVRP